MTFHLPGWQDMSQKFRLKLERQVGHRPSTASGSLNSRTKSRSWFLEQQTRRPSAPYSRIWKQPFTLWSKWAKKLDRFRNSYVIVIKWSSFLTSSTLINVCEIDTRWGHACCNNWRDSASGETEKKIRINLKMSNTNCNNSSIREYL